MLRRDKISTPTSTMKGSNSSKNHLKSQPSNIVGLFTLGLKYEIFLFDVKIGYKAF